MALSAPASGHPRIHLGEAPRLCASALAIGAFDGVHRGHQALIRGAVEAARRAGVPSVVWTFDPPPKVFFGRSELLTPLPEKLERLAFWEPDHIVVASFDAAYSRRSAEDFLDDLARLNPLEIRVGGDFRFGAGQAGDVAALGRFFDLRLQPPVLCEAGEVVSSSRIRRLRAEGRSRDAEALLGWSGLDFAAASKGTS